MREILFFARWRRRDLGPDRPGGGQLGVL